MDATEQLLQALTDAHGVPGYEAEVRAVPVSYTHLRAHETVLDLVCRLLLEKTKHLRHYCS